MDTAETTTAELDWMKRIERACCQVGLRIYPPSHQENPEPGKWSASYWNGSQRTAVTRDRESDLMLRLFDVFGRPGAAGA